MAAESCPGTNPECCCSECFGLREYVLKVTGCDHGLPKTRQQKPVLRLVEARCDSMTCECERCTRERAQRQPRRVRQPWEPKAA